MRERERSRLGKRSRRENLRYPPFSVPERPVDQLAGGSKFKGPETIASTCRRFKAKEFKLRETGDPLKNKKRRRKEHRPPWLSGSCCVRSSACLGTILVEACRGVF